METEVNEELLIDVKLIIMSATIENPVRSRVIESQLKIGGAEVREIIGVLRDRGVPVGSGSSGYWWARDYSELESTLRHLESRIRKESHHAKMLKRIYPEPVVQLALQL